MYWSQFCEYQFLKNQRKSLNWVPLQRHYIAAIEQSWIREAFETNKREHLGMGPMWKWPPPPSGVLTFLKWLLMDLG